MAEGTSDKSAEMNKEVEGVFKLYTLVTQLSDLTNKISEVENQCKTQGRYMPPYE